ncbi:hypothetical protein LTR48_009570, partial [Friedmanniomyces endolithicus]
RRPLPPMTWAAPTMAARASSPNCLKSPPTVPSRNTRSATCHCSMTTTCRPLSPASSIRPCDARPGWRPSTLTTESSY